MSKFDLSRIVGAADVSESDTELREIFLDKIRENPENFYPPLPEDEAEALRESIQANGLLEPLLVVPDGAIYRLVSGHNRLRALRDLRANAFGMDYKTALCRVLQPMDADHEITAIIEANRQRRKTPAVLQQEAEALTEVYVRRKQAGEDLPGRIRDRVAEAMQVSATKLANLNAIKNGIREPVFASAWASGNISEACALEIARMDAESQHQLAVWLEDEREPCALSLVREFNAISHKLDHDCKLAGMPCPNARAMYKAFVRHGTWEGCCGCCSCCLRRDTCSICCQYVERKAQAPVDEPTPEPAPPISEPKPGIDWQREREAFGARLRKAREETGLDRAAFAERIGAYKATYSAWENGSLPGSSQFPDLARALGVSTDYLYGLTDDPTPPGERAPQPEGQLTIAGWMPGSCSPSEPGEFAVLVDLGADGYYRAFMAWDGADWEMLPSRQKPELPIGWWLRLPPEPEKGETV
ncbi:helix-turn-helix domain-containing protein [Oscillibacter valericigenes]|uniref:Helix-turn-helix domain-containing protein n=1 Tax=Oscillibacter valericigenes TaxID=351091 RepID=A0ABS2FXG6_9FIRM|nr:helix-turn-helix domain-containing protein [Oscillibacter valericigenes]MBM6851581.1 helix-turn-helix domain-containing protein [Oscillibacter valericigenes]